MMRLRILAVALSFLILGSGCKKLLKKKSDLGASSFDGTGSSGTAVAARETGTSFTKRNLPIGTRRTEDTHSNVNMIFNLLGKSNNVTVNESSTKNEEIMETVGDTITKLRVTFVEDAKSTAEPGKPAKVKASPVAGKTYVVSSKDGKITVLNDKGKPAPKAESTVVEKKYKSLGKPDPFLVGMPSRPFQDGEDVPELSSALTDQVRGGDDKMTLESVRVSFRNRQGDSGIFDVSMTIKTGETGLKMTIPLRGTLAVRTADASPTAMKLTGPLTFEIGGSDKKPGIQGTGVLELTTNYTYK